MKRSSLPLAMLLLSLAASPTPAGAQGLSVDESTGLVQYDYPFELPPARGRYQPTLGLSSRSGRWLGLAYACMNANNGFGSTWSLSLPMITHDGAGNLSLRLTGRTVKLLPSTRDGASLVPEVETGYVKVTRFGSSDAIAVDAAGNTMTFSSDDTGKSYHPFLLTKVVDLDGNVTSYTWADGFGLKLERIEYNAFRTGEADRTSTAPVGETGDWGVVVGLAWGTHNGAPVLDSIQVQVRASPGTVNPSTHRIDPASATARVYQMAYGATASYGDSGIANDTSLASITEAGSIGGAEQLVTTFDRATNGCFKSATSPLGAKQEVTYLASTDFGDLAGAAYPVVKTLTTSGPAMPTGTVNYWYATPARITSGEHAGEYRGFTTTWRQVSGTGLVQRTTWDTASKPFAGTPLTVQLGTQNAAGTTTTPPTLTAFQTTTYTHAARSVEGTTCTASPTEPSAGSYPLIPVTTSELAQRVVDGVTLGTKRTTPCSKVDRWGNATEVQVDPDTGYTGDELTITRTYLVTAEPTKVCKDCVKTSGTSAGASLLEWTELSYDAASRLTTVQRQSQAGQTSSNYPVVATYAYFANGNLASRSEGGTSYGYTYDDWFQARVAKVSAADVLRPAEKQLLTESAFDGAGRTVKVVGPYYEAVAYIASARPERHLAYDGLGRLAAVARQPITGTSVTGGLAAFTYQPYSATAPGVPASVTAYQFAVAKSFTLGAPPQTEDARRVTTFLDGLGRQVQSRERLGGATGDPAASIVQSLGQGGAIRYLVSGTVVLDGAGRERVTVAPYYSGSAAYAEPLGASYAPGAEAVRGPVQASWLGRDTQGRVVCSTVRAVTSTLAASEPSTCTSSFGEASDSERAAYARATRIIYRGTTVDGHAVLGVKVVDPRFTTISGYSTIGPEQFTDAAGRLRRTEDPEGNAVSYQLDALGRPTGVVREALWSSRASIVSSVTLDMMGRVVTRTDPNLGGRSFAYDATTPGLLGAVTFTKTGEKVQYGYDLGRVASVQFCTSGGSCSTDSSLVWDVPYPSGAGYQHTAGRVGSATNQRTTIAFAYDDAGGMVRRDQWVAGDSRGFAFTATRREDGKVTSSRFIPGVGYGLPDVLVQTGFDSAGRPAQAWEGTRLLWRSMAVPGTGGTADADGTGAYDAWGRIAAAQVDEGRVEQVWTRGAASGLLLAQSVQIPGAANPVVYNMTGMIWRGTQLVGYTDQVAQRTNRFWYSQTGRLVAAQEKDSVTAGQVGLTCIGFNTSKEYKPGPSFGDIEVVSRSGGTPGTTSYDYTGTNVDAGAGPDAPTKVGSASLVYDAFGRVVSKGTGETFSYDLAGRLTGVTRAAGASETIEYDPFGLPVKRTVGGQATWYLGRQATITGVGGAVAADVHVEVNGQRVASVRVRASPRTLYLHRDRLTSVVATTLAGGVKGATYRYGPHGEVTAAGDVGDAASELGYAGTLKLTGGLLWMGARVYDPALRIFLQPDPLAPHQYTYADGDPINRWDPTGLLSSLTDYELATRWHYDNRTLMTNYSAASPGAAGAMPIGELEAFLGKSPGSLPRPNGSETVQVNAMYWDSTIGSFCGPDGYSVGVNANGGTEAKNRVVAPRSGVVESAKWENSNNKKQGYGLNVQIKTDVGLLTIAHLEDGSIPDSLTVGVEVVGGETEVGTMVNTGLSSGPHVHVDLRPGGVMNLLSVSGGPIVWSAPGWFNPLGPGGQMTKDYSDNHRAYDFAPGH